MTTGSMVLEDLTFKYTQESFPAVKGISIDIKNGETVALVGLSGSGKTTLGKIACSLFTPSSGKIYYDGVNQDDYHLDALRGSIGYIPQEANLHNRTILDNLRLGCDKTDKEIINFCSSLPFLDFIKMFPMGYHTMISEMGANISGGQRQRILVARVLLQKPKILVMDEATSSLDNISQAQVYEALDMLDCTKIVIAHRFATVLNADRILVLQNGCLVQEGKHNELVENEGPYRDLYHAESKGSETYELDYRKLS